MTEEKNTLATPTFTVSAINAEKAVIAYLNLAIQGGNRSYAGFASYWQNMFEKNSKDSKNTKEKAFKEINSIFMHTPVKEIQDFRNKFCIYEGSSVPQDMLEKAEVKGVTVRLAKNKNRHLSGFDVVVKNNGREEFRLHPLAYGLNEKEARKLIKSLPTKSEIEAQEEKLKSALLDDNLSIEEKRKLTQKYKAPYATHSFSKFMNRYTIHKCTDKQLTNDCVYLCSRVHIMNMQNGKPITYEFCEGSGKRKRSMKKVNRIKNKQRQNQKSKSKKK